MALGLLRRRPASPARPDMVGACIASFIAGCIVTLFAVALASILTVRHIGRAILAVPPAPAVQDPQP